ncbi:MAG: hypothetical protein FH762_11755 [Firmicutes bacterium]|nr:hypothetical protein [Bacillota bacterium]
MRKGVCLTLSILILLFISTITAIGQGDNFDEIDQYNNLRLGNDYIVIVVNMDENGMGRFAIETTGGAPFRNNDNNKPLIYGRPKPWTSYTSIWLNNEKYVFGGESGRRAGKSGKYGELIKKPYLLDDGIHTEIMIKDSIKVEQILSIVKSSTTGLYDAVQIKYRVENLGNGNEKFGLRIMLDTMLGQNDGAPFRIGEDAVVSDRLYYKKQLPEFWQAFDSISNPTVTSQGTFTGPGVTSPDKVYLADWGSLADGVWDFDFNPGEEFLRKGEFEIDSAIAMYWVPEMIKSGETKTYITRYGLGGITIVPGLISLGVTSPAEVTFDRPDKTFPIIAYIENTSEITAKNVRVNLDITDSLNVDDKEKKIGDLEAGEIVQLIWYVTDNDQSLPPKTQYTVKVEADNTDSNQVKREIIFVGPPQLKTSLNLIDKLSVDNGRLVPNPFDIQAVFKNVGGSTLYDLSTELFLPPGLLLATKERARKYPGNLEAGQEIKVNWKIKALEVDGKLPVAIDNRGLHGYQKIDRFDDLDIPVLDPYFYLKLNEYEEIEKGDYISIDIVGENIQGLDLLDSIINYDSEHLKLVHVSRGNIFLKDDKLLPFDKPDTSKKGIIHLSEIIPTEIDRGTLATLHFKVLKKGNNQISWGDSTFIIDSEESEVITRDFNF